MSWFGDQVENWKKGFGWKSGTTDRGWKAYQSMQAPGPYDFGYSNTSLSKRAFKRLPRSTKKTVLTEAGKRGGY